MPSVVLTFTHVDSTSTKAREVKISSVILMLPAIVGSTSEAGKTSSREQDKAVLEEIALNMVRS